MEMKY